MLFFKTVVALLSAATVVMATPEFAPTLKPGNCLNLRDQCVDQNECCPNLICDQSRGECVRKEDAEGHYRRRHRRLLDEEDSDDEEVSPWTEDDTEYGRFRNGLRRRDRDEGCRQGYWDPMRGRCVRSRRNRFDGRRHRRDFMDDDDYQDSDDWRDEDLRGGTRGKSCLVLQQTCRPGQCCRGLTCDENLRECLPDPRNRRYLNHKYHRDIDRNGDHRDFDHRFRRDLDGSRSNFGQHCARNSQCKRGLMCDKGLRQCVDERRRYRRDLEEAEL
ncbi:hypothetical protein EC968_007657 [Mortierella alpina]|nr:hypothetical protein EC968_007657 [Mortierella alpina]